MKRVVLALCALLLVACDLAPPDADADAPESGELVDCDAGLCQNGATCVDGADGFECECAAGYEGVLCANEIDPCDPSPCQHDGVCAAVGSGFACTCASGWSGTRCEINIDDCVTVTCLNGGTCVDGVDSYQCACAPGYQGDHCEQEHCALIGVCGTGTCDGQGGCVCEPGWRGSDCRENINECENGTPCLHLGACTDTVGDFSCSCATGYQGKICDACTAGYQDNDEDGQCCRNGYKGPLCHDCDEGYEDVNGVCRQTCSSAPRDCGDHGMCDDSGSELVCVCDATYYGEHCDSLLGTCTAGFCGANGVCVATSSNTRRCDCDAGSVGRTCEGVDDCALAVMPCLNGGTCVDGNGDYTCTCAFGWTGEDCAEVQDCDVAISLGMTPCHGHGACVDGDGAYSCTCSVGWQGADCDQADDCAGHGCQNNGRCVDGDNAYSCDCTGLDFQGDFCEVAIDNCASNPCQHGGTCTDTGVSFTCDCTGTGYAGATCQGDFDECAAQANICGTGTCDSPAAGGGYTCSCPDGTLDVAADGTDCAEVASLAAGARNSCAISAAGSLHCWGDNAYGQLGQGHQVNSAVTTSIPVGTGSNWSKLSVGGRHLCGLRAGHLYCWGDNSNRQVGATSAAAQPVPLEVRSDLVWTDVSLGESHSCALAGSDMYCWGNSADGQAGVATVVSDVDAPVQVAGTWSRLSAGAFHTCAINAANELSCWGRNTSGQVALPVGADGPWSAVQAGPAHTCATAGTRTYCWGEGTKGALGNGQSSDEPAPQTVSSVQTLVSLATGADFSCGAVREPDPSDRFQLYCWGANDDGLLLQAGGDVNVPTLLATSEAPTWTAYAVGDHHMCAVDDGLVHCWGNNVDGAVGNAAPAASLVTAPAPVKNAVVAHSTLNVCAANPCKNGGACSASNSGFSCDCTGTGFSGADCTAELDECATPGICGQGTCRDLLDDEGYTCACPHGLVDVDQTGTACEKVGFIAAGVNHTCVLTGSSRTLHCWGSNRYGQLGLGATGTTAYYPNENSQTYRTPLRLSAIDGATTDARGWTQLVVGENVTCGSLPNNQGAESLYCWGDNTLGQTGVGSIAIGYNPAPATATVTPSFHATPQLLDATRTWIALASSYATTCGIDSTGALYCWGFNRYGQAGNGSYGNPQITDGAYSFVPIMYAHATPVAPPSGQTWVSVTPGNTTTCARTNTNDVYCWGRRNLGQAGVGTTIAGTGDLLLPSKVDKPDPQGFTGVWNDITHSCALVGNAAYCWGQGTSGGIGNGANSNRSSPTLVSGSESFSSLSLGSNIGCGLVAVPATTPQAYTAYCWGNNPKNLLLTGAASANVPTIVNTSRQWELLDLGPGHACGVDHSDDKLYCWGDNGLELGAGQGKIGSVPARQTGNVGLIGPVRAAQAKHPAQ
jgi:alpha-tubulin suppressor-like RCC1 family protein